MELLQPSSDLRQFTLRGITDCAVSLSASRNFLEGFFQSQANLADNIKREPIIEFNRSCLPDRASERLSQIESNIKDETATSSATSSFSPRRSVKFADTEGGQLVALKTFLKHEEPMFCGSMQLKKALLPKFHINLSPSQSPALPIRSTSSSSTNLPEEQDICRLVQVEAEFPVIRGTIRVRNLEFRKHVFVRFTKNKWNTYEELSAYYIRSEDNYDFFSFEVALGRSFGIAQEVEFAVCFHVMNSQKFFWDSNKGLNYRVECVLQMKDSLLQQTR